MTDKEKLEKEIAELEAKKVSLMAVLDNTSQAINTNKLTLEEQNAEVIKIGEEVEAVRSRAETAKLAIQAEVDAKRKEIDVVLSVIADEKRKAEEKAELVYGTLKALENDVAVQEKALDAIKEEVAIQNAQILADFRAKQAEIDEKEAYLTVVSNRVIQAEKIVKSLNTKVTEIHAEITRAGEYILDLEQTKRDVSERIGNLSIEHKNAVAVIEASKEASKELTRLGEEIRKYNSEKSAVEHDLFVMKQELIRMREEKDNIEKINLGLVGRVDKLKRAQAKIKAHYEKAGVAYEEINFE